MSGYIPLYDPDGTIYNNGPQYGCIRPDKSLSHRYILLDKNNNNNKQQRNNNGFYAEYLTQISESNNPDPKHKQIVGGFKFNIDGIFKISNSTNKVWFIQILFTQLTTKSKRNVKLYTLTDNNNNNNKNNFNGTSIQTIKISNEANILLFKNFTEWLTRTKLINETQFKLLNNNNNLKSKIQVFSFKEIFTKFLLPIFMFIIFILFIIITVIFCRKEKMKRNFFQLPSIDYLKEQNCGLNKNNNNNNKKNEITKLSTKKIIKSKHNNSNHQNNTNCSSIVDYDCDKKPFSKLKTLFTSSSKKSSRINMINTKKKKFQFNFNKKKVNSNGSVIKFDPIQQQQDEPIICNSIVNFKDIENECNNNTNTDLSKFNELNSKLSTLTSKKSHQNYKKIDLLKSLKETEALNEENIYINAAATTTSITNKKYNLKNIFEKFSLKNVKHYQGGHQKQQHQKKSILKMNSQSSYNNNSSLNSSSRSHHHQPGILKSFSNQSFSHNNNNNKIPRNNNNYLYFNYNNNKMHYLNTPTDNDLVINDSNTLNNNDITISNQNLLINKNSESCALSAVTSAATAANNNNNNSSTLNSNQLANTSMSLSSSTKYILANKFKRLSGTEV
jgi:hypothetical protein